jgi:NADPH-dependent curcumin reductase CurA
MFEALMPHFNIRAQIVINGTIAQYAHPDAAPGANRLSELLKLFLYRFIEIRGFALPDHLTSYPEFLAEIGPWVSQGRIKYSEDFVDGLENIPPLPAAVRRREPRQADRARRLSMGWEKRR